MSSVKSNQLAISMMTTGCVTLNEIFDICNSTPANAEWLLDREELPNERIRIALPIGPWLLKDRKRVERDLAADGLELTQGNGRLVYVSGYAPRNDYNGRREVRATMMRYKLARSRSFSH